MSEPASPRPWASLPLHPFLVACLPVLWIHRTNLQSLYVDMLVRPLLLSLAVAGLLLLALGALTGSARRGAPAATLATLLVLYGGALEAAGVAVIAVMTLLLAVAGRRWRRPWPAVGTLFNVAALFLVVFNLAQSQREAGAVVSPQIRSDYLDSPWMQAWLDAQPRQRPDVYYLVLDGMGRLDVLEELYGIDGRGLRRRLQALGLQITEGSYANYPQTALSLASSLNMQPLEGFLGFPEPRARDRRPVGRTVSSSRVQHVLRHHGWSVLTYPSGYPFTRLTEADERRAPWLSPDLAEFYLLNETVLAPLQRWLAGGPSQLSFAARRRQIDFVFDDLPKIAAHDDEEPRFVFAHVLAPHPPFVFGRYGEALDSRQAFSYRDGDHWHDIHEQDDYRSLYRDQALYVMDRLIECLERIVERSPDAVIVVQGDHGPGSELEWASPSPLALTERMAIFNAYRVPEDLELEVTDQVTPVNSFRAVFNALFDADVAHVEDRVFYSSIGRPFLLRDLGVIESDSSRAQ